MGSLEPSALEMDDVTTVSSRENTSNPPKSHETVSVFGETSCGEPLVAQHIRINFTPTDPDNDRFTQNKCVEFWDFIRRTPEIQDLLVLSEQNKYTTVDSGDYLLEMKQSGIEEDKAPADRTAVSVLEYIEGKGLIDRTFEAKLPQSSWCSMGFKEYRQQDSHPKPAAKNNNDVLSHSKGQVVADEGSPIESTYAKNVCKIMADWDSEHVTGLDPPGHPPVLHHCVMQRTPH